MIDRSYLPFPSVRYYQDRGMAKWMGFFISEHSSALLDFDNVLEEISAYPLEKKIALLNQLYVQNIRGSFVYQNIKERKEIVGLITDLSIKHLIVKTDIGHIRIEMEQLILVNLATEFDKYTNKI
ncbi:hypothetical protein [Streptococcus suis]|uniref:hypothetical protein n=2 Tax=Streptococcus suis TaxID=1307 RepID=UPI000CF665E1|nr:hypothetical protein [Streptococcus suis]